jgi:hypothetical protein
MTLKAQILRARRDRSPKPPTMGWRSNCSKTIIVFMVLGGLQVRNGILFDTTEM